MKFTIITINYNNREGLRQTLQSVTSQTFTPFEYLVIDGGSTDGSVDVIREYESKITRWVSERDKGIYDAMNKGLRMANGEFVNFMNSGDRFADKEVLQRIAEAEMPTDTSIIYGDTWMEEKGQRTLQKAAPFWEPRPKELRYIYGLGVCHQSILVRTSLAKAHPFDNSRCKLIADFLQIKEIEALHYPIHSMQMPIAIFDRTGVSTTRRKQVFQEMAIIVGEYHTWRYYRFMWDYYYFYILQWAVASRVKKIRKYLHI